MTKIKKVAVSAVAAGVLCIAPATGAYAGGEGGYGGAPNVDNQAQNVNCNPIQQTPQASGGLVNVPVNVPLQLSDCSNTVQKTKSHGFLGGLLSIGSAILHVF